MIRFRILGGLELRDEDGNEVRSVLTQSRRIALLACLALAGGGSFVRRDILMGRLWPHSPQSRARHSLNQGLYGLRRSLGRKTVVSRGEEEVGLDPARLWCDARALEAAVAGGRDAEVLELYRGELLPGFFLPDCPDFETWLEDRRRKFRDAAVASAWRLADEAEETGRLAEAASWARRAVGLSGEDETGARRLLRLLDLAGDRAGAVAAYEALARRLRADPGVEPSAETQELIRQIRGPRPEAEPAPSPPLRVGNGGVPVHLGVPVVGRDEELARLEELLGEAHVRLVTVSGPGGVGKTRLAAELFQRRREDGTGENWFVHLAGVESPELVPGTVAQAMNLATGDGDPSGAVSRHLARRRGLLVLDNLDHLLGAAGFVMELLDQAPGLRVVATSREPLRLRGEWVLPLAGLRLNGEGNSGEEAPEALRLFAQVARRITGSFCLEPENREAVARICRLVEGIPLAIELAASWCRVMPLDEIAREIEESRGFLVGAYRDGPERHRSLEATFERSWALLEEDLRGVLARLSVFRGGFSREAAGAVAGASLDDLATLADKSLVRCVPGGRYEILEVIREFAWEKVAEDPEAEAEALEGHARYFAGLLEALAPGLAGPEKDDALARAAAEMDNIRSAWRTACRRGLLEALGAGAGSLFTVYDCRGWHREAEAAFRKAMAALESESMSESTDRDASPASPRVQARILARRAASLLRLGRAMEAEPFLRQGLELARTSGEGSEAAFILDLLSLVAFEGEDSPQAAQLQGEALRLRRELDDPREVATSLNNLASLRYAMGEYEEARRLAEECLSLQRSIGDRTGEVISLQNLGHMAMALGDPEAAEGHLLASLAAARHLRHGVLTTRSLLGLGTVANARGASDDARRYLQPALARAMQIGAESLAVEALLGFAWSLHHDGSHREGVELVGAVLSHPDLEPGARAAAERVVRRLEGSLAPEEAQAALDAGRGSGLRGAAARLAGPLPVE